MVFINEFHYDNSGTDIGEFIEIAGLAGTDLTGWSLVLYNGSSSVLAPYNTIDLSGNILTDDSNGFGFLTVNLPTNGLQNGSPDGFALVDDAGNVVQFLSYEGSFTAASGPAAGLTSVDIGIQESSSTAVGTSLQLVGTGASFPDFTWVSAPESPGAVNANQSFGTASGPIDPVINEFVFNHTGSDIFEFVEIFGSASTDYSSFTLIQLEGDSSGAGTIDSIFTLGSTDSDGFWTTGFQANEFENGTVTLLLVEDFVGSLGDDLDADNDGVLDAIPGARIVDSIAVSDGGSSDRTYGDVVLERGFDGLNSFTVGGASRIPNGVDTNTVADWVRNDFSLAGIDGQVGSPELGEAFNTPGAINAAITESDLPAVEVAIYDIQGAGHISDFVGERVLTTGIVTAVDSNGFYLQDATGDGNIATSDALFVFTGGNPGVAVGDELDVTGTVSEFTPGGVSTRNLSTTQIAGSLTITTLSTGNDLPAAQIIGAGGRVPPTEVIDDDAFASFDPATDGIDFFESLEGMLVTATNLVAVAGTNRFGEIFAVADLDPTTPGIQGATGISERGTLNISPDDFNPEKIQIDEDTGLLPGFELPQVDVGAVLGDVTGVISYDFGNFQIQPTQAFNVTEASTLEPEVTTLVGGEDQLTIASYNVLNLDPNDADGDSDVANGRFAAIAEQIVNNLKTPDVIGLQEIQDNSGSTNDGVTAADETLQALVDAIVAAGGPRYEFIDNTFIEDGLSGGQPGGNIRTAFLYNPNRVSLVEDSVQTISGQAPGEAFAGARLPLVADFRFNGDVVTVVNNHFSSKGGSAPILGIEQPFEARQEEVAVNGSLDERQAQSAAIQDFVSGLLAENADANLVVLGDLNEFEFVSPVTGIEAAGLTNLVNALPEDERYSFIFQGNSQLLDHILVSDSLTTGVELDILHINTEFAETVSRASDHDPLLARFNFEAGSPTVPGDGGGDNEGDGEGFRFGRRASIGRRLWETFGREGLFTDSRFEFIHELIGTDLSAL